MGRGSRGKIKNKALNSRGTKWGVTGVDRGNYPGCPSGTPVATPVSYFICYHIFTSSPRSFPTCARARLHVARPLRENQPKTFEEVDPVVVSGALQGLCHQALPFEE